MNPLAALLAAAAVHPGDPVVRQGEPAGAVVPVAVVAPGSVEPRYRLTAEVGPGGLRGWTLRAAARLDDISTWAERTVGRGAGVRAVVRAGDWDGVTRYRLLRATGSGWRQVYYVGGRADVRVELEQVSGRLKARAEVNYWPFEGMSVGVGLELPGGRPYLRATLDLNDLDDLAGHIELVRRIR